MERCECLPLRFLRDVTKLLLAPHDRVYSRQISFRAMHELCDGRQTQRSDSSNLHWDMVLPSGEQNGRCVHYDPDQELESGFWTGSPLKYDWLVLGQLPSLRKITPQSVHNIFATIHSKLSHPIPGEMLDCDHWRRQLWGTGARAPPPSTSS